MVDILVVLAQITLIILIADFLSGVAHWAQDRFDTSAIPLFHHLFIYRANEHHAYPNRLSGYAWLTRNKYSLTLLGLFTGAAWLLAVFTWQLCLLLTVLLFAGEVHIACHRTAHKNNWFITAFQQCGLIQSSAHHSLHHLGGNTHYCIITNYVNPVVDRLGVFQFFDFIFCKRSRATL